MNPYPGKVYNSPGYHDVYEGVKIDYSGYDVTRETLLKVLSGDREGLNGVGSGKVLAAGPTDRVFLFYSDHGSVGVLGMPDNRYLYADQLVSALEGRNAKDGFKELVAYIEACESGSMFQGFEAQLSSIYVSTASNDMESSWGTYCPGMVEGLPEGMSTCLGDLFSVAWMEDSEHADLAKDNLQGQFLRVQRRTSNNGTFVMGSHAQQYGDTKAITQEPIANYLATLNVDGDDLQKYWDQQEVDGDHPNSLPPTTHQAVAQRDADLVAYTATMAQAGPGTPRYQEAREDLLAKLRERSALDESIRGAFAYLLASDHTRPLLLTTLTTHGQAFDPQLALLVTGRNPWQVAALLGENSILATWATAFIEGRVLPDPSQPGGTQQVVRDWGCLRGMVEAWEGSCGVLGDYGMRHTRFFANLCNSGVSAEDMQPAAVEMCAGVKDEVE